jgi:hypothetical protein
VSERRLHRVGEQNTRGHSRSYHRRRTNARRHSRQHQPQSQRPRRRGRRSARRSKRRATTASRRRTRRRGRRSARRTKRRATRGRTSGGGRGVPNIRNSGRATPPAKSSSNCSPTPRARGLPRTYSLSSSSPGGAGSRSKRATEPRARRRRTAGPVGNEPGRERSDRPTLSQASFRPNRKLERTAQRAPMFIPIMSRFSSHTSHRQAPNVMNGAD